MSAGAAVLSDSPRAPARRQRLSPDDRREQIIEGAIAYFAEVGFEGSTRNLAERLGITQPLLYRYFPAKDDLIKAVYERLYVGGWNDAWSGMLIDQSLPLRDRLIRFYTSYTDVIFDPRWIRIYLYAGLKDLEINRWWIQFVERNIMLRVFGELRRELKLPDIDALPITAEEIDAFWIFHGGIFYYGVRREVYHAPPSLDREAFIRISVDSLLTGLPAVVRRAATA